MRWVRDPRSALTVLCGLLLLAGHLPGLRPLLYASVAAGSVYALRSALGTLRDRQLGVDVLMVLAAGGALAVGHPEEAAVLLFLFSLSGTLEEHALARTRSAIEGLVRLRPPTALLVDGDVERQVPVEALRPGDRIRIAPHAGVPTDAEVLEGAGAVDESAMTGESVPVEKRPGARLLGGTQNLDHALLGRVTAASGETALDKIVALVAEAQENKASGERISQWFGQRYTLLVLVAFAFSLGVRGALGQAWPDAFYTSLILLVALSPCALVISTPATTLSALAWAARNGILVRGGEYIERAASIDLLAIDKTGTLTVGRPELAEICVCAPQAVGACAESDVCWSGAGSMSREAAEILGLAAAAEAYSTHPLAEAMRRAASVEGILAGEAHDVREVGGLGVSARVGTTPVVVGRLALLEREGLHVPASVRAHAEEMRAQGMTVVMVAVADRLAALGFRDAVREEAAAFLAEMRSLGVREVVMVTGDTAGTAAAVARQVPVDRVEAGLMPADKERILGELSGRGQVLMVGDGINDAPSLARAHLGVAMGGLGSDIAMNSADVVLMRDRLDRIPQLIRLGRRTVRTVRANLLFAGGVIVGLTALSMIGQLPLPLAVLGHEGSTVLVILNGLRLLRGPGR